MTIAERKLHSAARPVWRKYLQLPQTARLRPCTATASTASSASTEPHLAETSTGSRSPFAST